MRLALLAARRYGSYSAPPGVWRFMCAPGRKETAMKTFPLIVATSLLGMLVVPPVFSQQGDGTSVTIDDSVWKPDKVPADDARIAQLRVAPGFKIEPFARDLKSIRVIAAGPDGAIYVSRRDQGDVLLLRDDNGDGKADGKPQVVARRAGTHGIAVHDNRLYLVTVKEIFVADIQAGGKLGPLTMIVGDLPDAGQHPNRTIAFGPDDKMYVSVGSTCNACNESNPENATILQATADGKTRIIFASGLRNTIGFDWHPRTGELWGLDHGIDHLGDERQTEEVNLIQLGKKYGWPHVYGLSGINPQTTPPGGITKEQWRATSRPMVRGYTAHAAPMQFVFYRRPASGYEIVRVHFDGDRPVRIQPFVTGFLTDGGTKHFARPVGLAIAKDGSLLMADDANGVLYRVFYTGQSQGQTPLEPPATAMDRQFNEGNNVPLALQRAGGAPGSLVVTSKSIAGVIPKEHSEYHDGVSPEVSWNAVSGAKSYALIMEDPDATYIKPFVHWVAWNIPAGVTTLPEGLQEQPRLTEPEGVLQGRTSRGSVGYYGPRPPVGDPPHRYHFQVFALDAMLDVPPGASRDDLLRAMSGHVLAAGELVGTYQQTVEPPK
jgi:Raf kinase inhibitor-like YbhB/YbcL family protein